jgi:hypothetical protein
LISRKARQRYGYLMAKVLLADTELEFLDGEEVLPGFRCSIRDWMSCP